MKGPPPPDAWFLIVRSRGGPGRRPFSLEVMRDLPRAEPIAGLQIIARISEASAIWLSIDEIIQEILDGTLPLWAHDARA